MPVSAQVLLNGKSVGTTGAPFSYSPHAGDPNPSGVVHEPIAYFDATFSISLVDPTWTLFLQAGPIPVSLDTIKIDLDLITWTVTPDWNSALAKTITAALSPPSATAAVNLPKPPGAVKSVAVAIAGRASTKGGDLNGFTVPAQSFAIGTASAKVAFHGPNERMGWLLQPVYVTDQTSMIIFNVNPTLLGIDDVP